MRNRRKLKEIRKNAKRVKNKVENDRKNIV